MLLATRCPSCDRAGPAPCAACVARMDPAPEVPVAPGLDDCFALLAYEGPARDVVTHLKYRNARATARWLAEGMARLVPPGALEVVTWAPTTELRRRSRGFDHAELLARQVAAELGLPLASTLRRLPGPPQTGRTLLERRDGPQFLASASLTGRSVLVVDDVVTTGATLASAARTLRAAGADHVVGLAAAHPP
ncbi:MAG: phosphoribosyltransferase family protein [Acidimicrobiales bacterium]